jgi:C1A family cysteine protease
MTLNAIKKAIDQKNAHWTPKVSIVSELTESQKKMLLGLNKPEGVETAEKAIPGISVAYPEKWDWRDASVGNIHGDVTTAIRDQSGCGLCVAHATCAMIECTYDVFKGDPGKNLDLSEQDLFSHGGNCNTGWTFVPAMNTAKNGIPDICPGFYSFNNSSSKIIN